MRWFVLEGCVGRLCWKVEIVEGKQGDLVSQF